MLVISARVVDAVFLVIGKCYILRYEFYGNDKDAVMMLGLVFVTVLLK